MPDENEAVFDKNRCHCNSSKSYVICGRNGIALKGKEIC